MEWTGGGSLVLTLLGDLALFPQQGKHKAPATSTHPPLTPTFQLAFVFVGLYYDKSGPYPFHYTF